MKKSFLCLTLLLSCISCVQKQKSKKFNLDFETYNTQMLLPDKWFEWGNYNLQADTVEVHSGNYSAKVSSKNKHDSFGCIAYRIPANFSGKKIKLEGYMKLKNVENGFGGLLLRLDNGNSKTLEFSNMKNQNINGTKNWKKYVIELPFPKEAKRIYIGGILLGKGEAWFDDFVLTVDGKDIQTFKEIEEPVFKAKLDKEFDHNSNVKITSLDDVQIENLELLGRVWGLLKYHHPEIAKGNYNWDYELFRILPKYQNIKNNLDRDQLIISWIDNLGTVEPWDEYKETSKDALLKPDLDWIDSEDISDALKEKLQFIIKNRHQGNHYYIEPDRAKNPKFKNEKLYYSMSFKDDGFKLLALYRYWNMIQYYFPYKYLTDNNWNTILKDYIPKVIQTKNKLEYELVMIELIGEINDTHATTYTGFNNVQNKRGKYFAPFKVSFIENKLVVTDYYNPEYKDKSKLKVGDIITHVNGKTIQSILDSVSNYYPASNQTSKFRNISRDILRSNSQQIKVNYLSNNQEKHYNIPLILKDSLNLNWYNWKDEKCYKVLDNNIGYVTLQHISKSDIPEIKSKFKNTKGIIIDIRNYPSTFVPFKLGNFFVSSSTPFVKFTTFSLDNPGEFLVIDGPKIPKDRETFKGKLVVLVNEDSQSQSEYTAMAFRAGNNTTIMGSTTAGADGNVSSIYLPGGLRTNISGIGIYYPDGTETQRVGIVPDIVVKPTIQGIKDGRDEVLEKAIEVILND
ncbi:peptidase S41 [Hyunsoonleella sp. SJ7]|uniref:Peptidase S41 n=2 Tax=Hyunsoonleella aquatilis TaxID=2762758 RepID=A0A923HBT2_9FLAO|nr:peptidase S41 [Hyunsoonleella aquatilis]